MAEDIDFSADVLANIKTNDDSDNEFEEESKRNSPVFLNEELPETVTMHEPEEDDSKEDCEEDPLEEYNVEVSINTAPFVPEYNDEDVRCHSGDEEQSCKTARGAKKVRLTTELKGRNGYQWSAVRGEVSTGEKCAEPLPPRCKGPARLTTNPLEAWLLLVDEPIIAQLVRCTNEKIRKRKGKKSWERTTDITEMYAWLGLNYLCAAFRNSMYNGPLDELWTLELGNAVFRAVMTYKRFEFLADCLRFHELKKAKQTPMEPVQEIWDRFTINCRSYYAPSSHCAIDEHILSSNDAECPFQHKLPHNPTESGLRMITLCDTKTLYLYNGFVAGSEKPKDMEVLNLVCDIKDTGRSITLSERYTTLALANKLQQFKLCLVGALPVTARELPSELLQTKTTRKLYAPDICLTVALNSPKCSTGFLLTAGLPLTISGRKLYELTCQSCQRCQQMCNPPASVSSANYRWPLQFFHTMLNYAAFNAWILLRLSEKGDASITQRDFLRQLGLYLTQQQLRRRLAAGDKIPMMQRLHIAEILGESTDQLLSTAAVQATNAVTSGIVPRNNLKVPEGITLLPKELEKRLRCRKCKRSSGSTTTKSRCQQCLRPLCHKHLIARCDDCTGVVLPATDPTKEEI